MKKTITMLLLTALCVTVLTSCDLGNGLVAELLGGVKDAPIGEQIYPTDEYIEVENDILIDIEPVEPPVVEIETTPPYEIGTGEYTGPYTTGDDTRDPYDSGDVEVPDLVCSGYLYVEGVYKTDGSCEPETEILLTEEQLENWDGFIHIDESLECIRIVGYAGYNDSDDMTFYYWLNTSTKKHTQYVTTFTPDDATIDKIKEAGAEYPVGFAVTVPTGMLKPGMNGLTLLADPIGALIDGWVYFADIEIEMFTTVPEDTTEPAIEEPIID